MAERHNHTEGAYAQQQDARMMLARHGRSFHFASHLLGRDMGDDAARLYAFCRLLDDMADGDISGGPDRLASIRSSLCDDTAPTDPALISFLPVINRCRLPRQAIIHLLDGLLADQEQVALADTDSLIRYSYQVAGTVGLLMCGVMRCTTPAAHRFAIDMGIAMQMTNIARDVLEDAQMGRRYLPAEWVGGLSADDISGCATSADSPDYLKVASAITRLLDTAEQYYRSGEAGLGFLNIRPRLAIGVAGRVYRQIGVKLASGGTRWGHGRTVTGFGEKVTASLPGLLLALTGRAHLRPHDSSLHTALYDMLAELDMDR